MQELMDSLEEFMEAWDEYVIAIDADGGVDDVVEE